MKKHLLLTVSLFATLITTAALTGCAGSTSTMANAPVTVKAGTIKGRVMGGQQPVAYAAVQLYYTGSSGYGTASTPLISTSGNTIAGSTPVSTDSNGNFTITSDFACPTLATTPVYLTITGGNPGNTGGITNNNLALMAALGPCNNLVNIPFVNVNELTTVASVWALAPFMSAIDHVGTSSTNTLGLANAFAAVNKLVNIGNGTIGGSTLPSGATLPTDEISSLGDILAVCINSTGATSTSDTTTNCGKLFNYTTYTSSTTHLSVEPQDTVAAAMSIAQNPSQNVAGLYNLIPSISAQFPTNAYAQPAAWTIAIQYTGSGIKTPKGIATDASGNVWIANSGNNTVTKLDTTGAAQSGTSGYNVGSLNIPYAIAIDAGGNAWITNSGNNSITQIAANGATGTPYSGNGLSVPKSIAIDESGNVWVANNGTGNNSVSAFTSGGGAIGNYAGAGITTPLGIAVNPQ